MHTVTRFSLEADPSEGQGHAYATVTALAKRTDAPTARYAITGALPAGPCPHALPLYSS